MINRVTQQTVQRSTLANVQLNLSKMADLQGRMSGGKVITRPSDDPAGTAQAMSIRSAKRAAEQHARNAADGVAWLSTADSALTGAAAQLRRARDLTVQGANSGAQTPSSRAALATEIENIRDGLLDQANTTYLGRSVFAGTSDAAGAFTDGSAVPPYAWTGAPGATVERRTAPDTTIRADADGALAFGTGTDPLAPGGRSVFALLDQIAADLRSGAEVGPHLTEIDTRMEAMLGELAAVGSRYTQMTAAQSSIQGTVLDLTSQLSDVEDIDLAATIMELEMQEVAYKGALGATARVLQPTLMDFLR